MKSLIKSITINRIYTFFGSKEDLNAHIRKSNINHTVINEDLVEFAASISWGTGTHMPPIAVKVSVVKVDFDEIKVMIKTIIRPEQYFVMAVGIIVLVASFFQVDEMPVPIYVLLVWIFFHVWFHFVFRVQENILAKKVAKALNLRRHRF